MIYYDVVQMLYLYPNEIHLNFSIKKKLIEDIKIPFCFFTWSSLPSSDVFVLSGRADLGINKLSGIDSRLSFSCISSFIFESNGLVDCSCNCLLFVRFPFDGEDVAAGGAVGSAFNHFHLLDLGGRCNGGLWLTDVICDICDSCVSIRSEIVSSLSRVLTFNVVGNCKCCGGDGARIVVGDDSSDSVVNNGGIGWIIVGNVDGDVCWVDDGGGVGTLETLCAAAARFSWEILRNFDINFRTGWSELIWSNPSFFLVSANSRSRLTSAILRKIT